MKLPNASRTIQGSAWTFWLYLQPAKNRPGSIADKLLGLFSRIWINKGVRSQPLCEMSHLLPELILMWFLVLISEGMKSFRCVMASGYGMNFGVERWMLEPVVARFLEKFVHEQGVGTRKAKDKIWNLPGTMHGKLEIEFTKSRGLTEDFRLNNSCEKQWSKRCWR